MNRWNVIRVPFESGSDRKGSGLAPLWLTERCFADINKTIEIVGHNDGASFGERKNGIKNYDNVLDICTRLRDEVYACRAKAERVLTIGGDHTIALGSIAGVLKHAPNTGVIWFDAHGDINTEATSPSANAHGMPVAALMGLCTSGLNEIAAVRLKPKNIFWVGARDLDDGEVEILQRLGIMDNVYSTERVHQIGMQAVMDDIRRKMQAQGIEQMHLSFDIDGMDPSFVQATGTKVEKGLLQADADAFIDGLKLLPQIESMDFVEYNPTMDDAEYTTGRWCVETMRRLVKSV